jgi:hypothetical protein
LTLIPQLAASHARDEVLNAAVIESYLNEAIKFRIEPPYRQAIEEFGRRLGEVPNSKQQLER